MKRKTTDVVYVHEFRSGDQKWRCCSRRATLKEAEASLREAVLCFPEHSQRIVKATTVTTTTTKVHKTVNAKAVKP